MNLGGNRISGTGLKMLGGLDKLETLSLGNNMGNAREESFDRGGGFESGEGALFAECPDDT